MAKEPTKSSKDKAGSAAPKDKKEASPTTTTAPAAKAAGSSKASTPDSKKAPPSSAEKGAVKKEEVAKVAKNKKEEDKKDTKKDAAKEDGGEKKNKEEEAKVNGDKSKAETAAEDEAKDTLFSEPSVPIRLTYFDGAGRAELIRLVLAVGKMDYEDRRIGSEQWTRLKPTTPFSQLPVLEYHGKHLGQSLAIARFLAGKAGLYGRDEVEKASVDAIVDYVSDYNNKWLSVFRAECVEEKIDIISGIFVSFIPTFLGNVQSLLKEAGGKFFVGDKLSLADLAIFLIFHSFSNPDDPFFATLPYVDERIGLLDERFPLLNEHMIRIYNVPEVKGWMTRRPLGLF